MISLSTVAARQTARSGTFLAQNAQALAEHAVRTAGPMPIGPDQFASLCPDWRAPAVALEGLSGRILYANGRSRRFLESGGPARVAGGRLTFSSAEFTRRFYTRLERALAMGAESAVAVMRDERSGEWLSVTIHIVPDSPRAEDGPDHRVAVVEFATSLAKPDHLAVGAMGEAIGLSPAETHVIEALAHGKTPAEIAEARGVSISTVRQRIKAVLAKTRCGRQAELISLVRAICPVAP